MPVGFIGLGNLGRAMAGRLASEGVDLLVWNRTSAKADASGLPVANTPSEIATRCDTIILNLFHSQAVREVLTGQSGLLSGGIKGKTIIDTTTNHFHEVLEFHAAIDKDGGSYLEAPVLGSVIPATQGTLTILVSGAHEDFESHRPLFDKLGKNLIFIGQPGLAGRAGTW